MLLEATKVLKQYWGYDSFRPQQIPLIEAILSGQDTIGLLTTGGGKSICFQVPAMMREGICLVISPLIALMKDQVEQLKAKKIPALAYYGSQPLETRKKIMDYALDGKLKFLYIAPERLQSKEFQQHLKDIKINYIVIDEAHCISQWGYDFRPSYLAIPKVYTLTNDIPRIALTATATPFVVQDIAEKLRLNTPKIVQGSFFRPNLSYQIHPTEKKIEQLAQIIKQINGSGLVYVHRRNAAEELSQQLKEYFGIQADYYHAGLSMEQRNKKQNHWLQHPNAIIIATNAFGMGIDNPKVRFVIHYHLPDSLEAYFQECGRAGRDGEKSYAITLLAANDVIQKEDLIKNYPTPEETINTLILLFNFYEIPFETGLGSEYEFEVDKFIQKYKLDTIKTAKCLQILKDNQFIDINDAYYQPDELQIIADEHTIQQYSEQYPEYGILIKHIIRSFDGIFYRKRVSLNSLAQNYHYSLTDLRAMLRRLHQAEIVFYKPATNKPSLKFLIAKPTKQEISIDQQYYLNRKKIFVEQINALLSYIDSQNCRSQILLHYFGEKTSKSCGICDNCVRKNRLQIDKSKDYIDIKDKILSYLTQTEPQSIENIIQHLSTYSEKDIRRVLDRLLELDSIAKTKDGKFILS